MFHMEESLKQQSRTTVSTKGSILPPPGAMVVAVCSSFQCLAFRDERGIWRNFFGKDEIREAVIEWKSM